MSNSNLPAETRLEVQSEVSRILTKLGALFGVANIAVLLGAIWFMWSSVTGQTAGLAGSVKQEVLADLSTSRGELNDAVNTANQLIGRLEQSRQNLDEVENDIEGLQADLVQLGDVDTVRSAADFLTAWKGAPDLAGLTARVAQVETEASQVSSKLPDQIRSDMACSEPRVFLGRTAPTQTAWTRYGERNYGAFVDVDTSMAGFTQQPLYFTSLGGGGSHWYATGTGAIYSPKNDGFRTYVRWADSEYGETSDLLEKAKASGWHVNWVAIGC